jgi:hypothetical protein
VFTRILAPIVVVAATLVLAGPAGREVVRRRYRRGLHAARHPRHGHRLQGR